MSQPAYRDRRFAVGLGFALVSALSFGASGSLARGLLDTGWSAGATVTVRVLLAAVVLAPAAVLLLRGRWGLLRRNLALLAAYGLGGVALAQFAYFNAIRYLPVSLALLIEYTAPVAVVGYLWLRRGQRPTRLTLMGGLLAMGGLLLVLDVLSGGEVNLPGVGWGLLAMVGAASYWILSADEDNGLPPLVLAAGGMFTAGGTLLLLGATGLIPFHTGAGEAVYAVGTVPAWLPLAGLGLFTAALSYATGIAAARRLGSRVASFLGLTEVLAALGFAWLLLHELPGALQLLGGALVLAGVVVVKLGEPRIIEGATPEADVAVHDPDAPA